MDMKDFKKDLIRIAGNLESDADRYAKVSATFVSELFRCAQKVVFEVIDRVERECESFSDVEVLLADMCFEALCAYKRMHREGHYRRERFAEVRFTILDSIIDIFKSYTLGSYVDKKDFTDKPKAVKQYGKIVDDEEVSRVYIAGADITLLDKSSGQLALSCSVDDNEPMVTLDGKTFVLPWDDIIELADLAGLFKDSKSEVTE